MLKKEASAIVGNLSHTSKMPGPSFGLSAFDCKTGSKLREKAGSVCASCYARKGQYTWPNVRTAHTVRLAAVMSALTDTQARATWVAAMVTLLRGVAHFRWHDSGDLQSLAHFRLIAEVCRATPDTSHWLPTHEPRFIDRQGIPSNLVVRVSAPMMDSPAPSTYANTSTVHTSRAPQGSHVCPAPSQGGACASCRACWDATVSNVSYHAH